MQQQHQQQQQQQQQREQQQRDQQQQQQMQQQQQQQQRQQAQDEPPTKRQRTEDNLIPEGEFMARNLSPVSFKVTVPVMEDKTEWSCSGQTLTLSLHLHDTVASIKTRIHEEVGMPPGKQKLQNENIFYKDANTLAYYNITPGAVINLQLKERGGRKK